MDENFYKIWFKGFAEGLDNLDSDSRSCLLKDCAKQCADTGVLKMYQQHYLNVNGNRDEFYGRISELGGARGEVAIPNKEYYIFFPECYCDLHTTGGVDTANLCECSRQSIIYVGEKIWGKNTCKVETIGTVLGGAKECKFKIIFND